ncbi:hypothetical protein Tco_1258528, partial [Tanacetum coccineum]
MDFRSFIMEGVDGEFNFLPESGLDEEGNFHSIRSINNEALTIDAKPLTAARPSKVGTSSKAARKRKQTAESFEREPRQKVRKAVLDNMLNSRTHKLMSTLSKARASCDAIRERKVKKDKVYAELEMKCNEALQDLEKNPLVLDMRSEIVTLQGQVDKLHSEYCKLILEEKKWVNYEQNLSVLRIKVEGLESKREWLNSSKIQLLQEIDSLRQDRAAVVSKVVPHVATELVGSNEMGLLVARLIKAAMFYGSDDLATTSYPFIAEATADLYATIEQLLSKKPRSLRIKPAPSYSKPSSSKAPIN